MIEERKAEGPEMARRYFAARRGPVAAALESMASRRGGELSAAPGGGRASLHRIVEFCLRGKMIRGCLVFLGAEACAGTNPAAAADSSLLGGCAAAMELFQAGLLAHDDIMDRDELRRGLPSLHAAYAAELLAAGSPDSLHAGEALGICLGDLCYFEAFAALAVTLAGNAQAGRIQELCGSILGEVALAQMADVRWGASKAEPGEAEILAMYRCKTARYSFSLPLAVGALAGGALDLVPALVALGEELGILFQLRDDELGLFGSEASTGKGRGSDLREGKKTLFRARLLAAAPPLALARLEGLFSGAIAAQGGDMDYIRSMAEELGVVRSLATLSRSSEEQAHAIIASMSGIDSETRGVLESLVDYVTRREK